MSEKAQASSQISAYTVMAGHTATLGMEAGWERVPVTRI